MSRSVAVAWSALSLLVAVIIASSANAPAPPQCATLPNCECAVQNATNSNGDYEVMVATIKCNNIGLTEVPDFANYAGVREIFLQNNEIRKVSRKEFAHLSHLNHLDLSGNLIDEIDDGSFNATLLKILSLRHNNLSAMPTDLLDPTRTLTYLDLRHNRFTEIPTQFLYRNQLISLDMSHNPIGSLSSYSFAMDGGDSRMEDLFLINCSIQHIAHRAFDGLRNLRCLELDQNHFKVLNQDVLEGLPNSLQILSAINSGIEVLDRHTFRNMHRLRELYLDYNNISTIDQRTFKRMNLLKVVSLESNRISDINKKAFWDSRIESLYLSWNKIRSLHESTFKDQDELVEIYLMGNQLTTIHPDLFSATNVVHLQVLDLGNNQLVEFPIIHSNSLLYYHLESNRLRYADANVFAGVPNVQILKLSFNALVMHDDVLKPLGQLKELIIQWNYILKYLPSLENNAKMTGMDIVHCDLQALPEDICTTCPSLKLLSVYGNYLTHVPKLQNCTHLDSVSFSHNEIESLENYPFNGTWFLQVLELDNNKITSLPTDVFANLTSIRDLFLEHNSISRIPLYTFKDMHNMQILNLSYNPVRELQDRLFHDMDLVNELYLKHMGIQKIGEDAFPDKMEHLLLLDLSDNNFDYLPMPETGWPQLRYLYLYNVYSLFRAPGPLDCPRLDAALFTYTYHCCAFKSKLPPDWHKPADPFADPIEIRPTTIDDSEDTGPQPPKVGVHYEDFCDIINNLTNVNITALVPMLCGKNITVEPLKPPKINRTEVEIIRQSRIASLPLNNDFVCSPRADPMTPCEDLLGSWALRVLIWVVFVVTLFGNGLVLTVILASPKPPRRLGPPVVDRKVSQFYISQLAVADIGIGIYLGFLAVVDLKTFGTQEFYQVALSWQYGPGCLTAGFIAILSSELSVYILVVITLERVYVYLRAMSITKMHISNAVLVILLGWVFAVTCAILPLLGFNNYNSVAICLPFDVRSTKGRYYISMLMGINLLAFVAVASCNIYLFCKLRSSRSVTSSEAKMFRMVFVLIITDFLCWAPLVLLSLAAVFNRGLINTSTAKWFAVLVLPINACLNPFLYGLLTEKFKQQMQGICHSAKRLLPRRSVSGITRQEYSNRRNSISMGEFRRPSYANSIELASLPRSFGQNSPGSLSSGSISSASTPFLGRRASLPALGTDGLRNGSPRTVIRYLPTPLNDSMPELNKSDDLSEPIYPLSYPRFMLEKSAKNKSALATVREQATEGDRKNCVMKNGVDIKTEQIEKASCEDIIMDKVSSDHNIDVHSATDSPSLGIGSYEDSHSITSLSVENDSSFSNGHRMISFYNSKLISPVFIEETDV